MKSSPQPPTATRADADGDRLETVDRLDLESSALAGPEPREAERVQMPRPRRRCRGGRVTPKGTRPGERPSERRPAATPIEDPQLVETLLEDAADAAEECADLDEAEVWASSAQVLFRPFGLATSPVLNASRALAAAETSPDRAAAATVAASISAYGPPLDQRRATRLLARLAEAPALDQRAR